MVVVLGVVAVNAFGAWAVSRRKPRVSRLFLLSAVVLVVAAVALGYGLHFASWILAAGLGLSWLASYLNARLGARPGGVALPRRAGARHGRPAGARSRRAALSGGSGTGLAPARLRTRSCR